MRLLHLFIYGLCTLRCTPDLAHFQTQVQATPSLLTSQNPNHLIGKWHVKTWLRQDSQYTQTSSALFMNTFHQLLEEGSSIFWIFNEEKKGSLNIQTPDHCEVHFLFSLSYCCEKMHQLILSQNTTITQQPSNCWNTSTSLAELWEKEVPLTYHFLYDSSEAFQGQVLLQGPYQEPPVAPSSTPSVLILLEKL